MSKLNQRFLRTVEEFLVRSGMSASYFGKTVMNDGKLVSRLRGGASVSLTTAEKVLSFIRAYDGARKSRATGADGDGPRRAA